MTREEQTAFAYKDYLNNGGMLQSNPWFAFKAGAEWADKNPSLESLWHDASEEPFLEEKEFIFLNEQGNAFISFRFGSTFAYMYEDFSWRDYVKMLKITKWIYIEDLLF